jgi:hypothetical protein
VLACAQQHISESPSLQCETPYFFQALQECGDSRQLADVPQHELNNALLAEVQRENDARGRPPWESVAAVQARLALFLLLFY